METDFDVNSLCISSTNGVIGKIAIISKHNVGTLATIQDHIRRKQFKVVDPMYADILKREYVKPVGKNGKEQKSKMRVDRDAAGNRLKPTEWKKSRALKLLFRVCKMMEAGWICLDPLPKMIRPTVEGCLFCKAPEKSKPHVSSKISPTPIRAGNDILFQSTLQRLLATIEHSWGVFGVEPLTTLIAQYTGSISFQFVLACETKPCPGITICAGCVPVLKITGGNLMCPCCDVPRLKLFS